jgi:hypothetical protein
MSRAGEICHTFGLIISLTFFQCQHLSAPICERWSIGYFFHVGFEFLQN